MRNQKTYSLTNRLTLWYSFCGFILLTLASSYMYVSLEQSLNDENGHILYEYIRTIQSILNRPKDPIGALQRRVKSEWALRDHQKVYVKISDSNGIILAKSSEIPFEFRSGDSTLISLPSYPDFEKNIKKIKASNGESYLTFSGFLEKLIPDKSTLKIAIGLNSSHEEKTLKVYRSRIPFVLLLGGLFSLLIGRILTLKGFKPVNELISKVKTISSGTLHERIQNENWSSEITTLAETFNEMLDRLHDAFTRLSNCSADIAHEIRTPLNNIRGESEVILIKDRTSDEYKECLLSNLEECKRISKIVDSLLFLAGSENPETKIKKERIELKTELSHILEFYEASATEAQIKLKLADFDNIPLEVERTLFQRALGNVISNSINHTAAQGQILINLTPLTRENFVSISIKDTGSGIDPKHLPWILDRFYRADESRTTHKQQGFGLGLSLVQGIIRLHGGKIKIQSELGKGTEVQLIFPVKITKS